MYRFATCDDLIGLKCKYPHLIFDGSNGWGLKQMGYLFVYDLVSTMKGARVLELGAGLSPIFDREIGDRMEYHMADRPGFYDGKTFEASLKARTNTTFHPVFVGEFSMGLDEASFDAVFSISALEHVPPDQIESVCRDMYRIVKPGGKIIHTIDIFGIENKTRIGEAYYEALVDAGFHFEEKPNLSWQWDREQVYLVEPLDIVYTYYMGMKENPWTHPRKVPGHSLTITVIAQKPEAHESQTHCHTVSSVDTAPTTCEIENNTHLAERRCPVCDCEYVCHLRDVPTKRTKKIIPLYYCLRCRSMANPSGFIEEPWFLKAALEWHKSVHERNVGYSNSLFDNLCREIPRLSSVLEIGCGTGTLLKVAAGRGMSPVKGFDLNHLATGFGCDEYDLDLRAEPFSAESLPDRFDLVACISVLEHLEHPRELFGEISRYCIKHGSAAYISVPFFEEDSWHFLKNPDPSLPGTLFADNDCHVTHFTRDGFKRMCRDFGATRQTEVWGGAWRGFLIEYTDQADG
ncbi:hypothetical protein JCM14469_05180 [Desulfatiferula olefinivorans]